MQVSLEKTSTFEYRLTVATPKERLDQEVQKRLRSLARTAKIKGFRASKVPMRILENKYGKQARQESINELIQSSFSEAIQQYTFNILDQPTINVTNVDDGLSYTADFSVMPSASEIQIEGLKIEKPVAEIQESDVDAMIEKLRYQRQTREKIKGPAIIGDEIGIEYFGSVGDVAGQFNHTSIILGEQNELPQIDEVLEGCSVDDKREFDTTFAEDHSDSQLAGNTVHFTVYVRSIQRLNKLPTLDSEFIKSFGVEDGSMPSLRQAIRSNLEKTLSQLTRNSVKKQILESLLTKNPIAVPQSMIDAEVQRLKADRDEILGVLAEDSEDNLKLPDSSESLKGYAKHRVQLGMLINELIKANQIEATPEKMREIVQDFSEAYEDSQAAVEFFYKSRRRMREIEAIVLENEVVDLLLKNAEISEKEISFYKLTEESNRAR